MDRDEEKQDIIDEDLYEELDEEELYELVQEEKRKALDKEKEEKKKPKRPFPKWLFWLIAIVMTANIAAVIPKTFSIPAADFLMTSAKLSTNDTIDSYQEAVVVVETSDGRGTGFAYTPDGQILTNHHVIENERRISVAFPEQGLFKAEVIHSYPEIDLAVLDVQGENLPHLDLAEETTFREDEHFYFIGNPLRFSGIANEGTIIDYTEIQDWTKPVLMLEAPIYKGNSGSPVINDQGEVIGVVFATLDHDVEGRVGLAVPIDYYHEKNNHPEAD
ncbi:S1C family serine protease [Thalassobacillus sp. CUG 92003]|uniref:S1C family serine protease n=1 Tax=Thalassobacillus sp. CUG 92003 TaxID=2736641 RepID=UPI0015E66B4E|nr:serine protease [Thalassobacillus sp. CUG 92003]